MTMTDERYNEWLDILRNCSTDEQETLMEQFEYEMRQDPFYS